VSPWSALLLEVERRVGEPLKIFMSPQHYLFSFIISVCIVVSPLSALLLEVERRVGELMGKTSALTLPGAFILDLFGPLRSGNHLHNIGKPQTKEFSTFIYRQAVTFCLRGLNDL
jgi:hypothetical protein